MSELPNSRPQKNKTTDDGDPAVPPTLCLQNLNFTYSDTARLALNQVSAQIRAGESLAVVGPLGSGTSTLCRATAGLLAEQGSLSGTIKLASPTSVAMLGDDPEAQLTGLASLVADEVRLPGRLTGLPEDELASRAVVAMQSVGIEVLADRRVETLSGGERQLTALAALLTLQPQLLVLDQPTLSLDPQAQQRLRQALEQHCERGGAVLISAARADALTSWCQSTRYMQDGRLLPAKTLSPSASTAPELPLPCADNHVLLRAENLQASRGGTEVLSGVEFDLHAGEVLTVTGPNGAGKSTLLRALAGLLPKDASGPITLFPSQLHQPGSPAPTSDSQPSEESAVVLSDFSPAQRAQLVGWVGQDPGAQLSAATVERELELVRVAGPQRRRFFGKRRHVRVPIDSAKLRRRRAYLLDLVGLDEYRLEHPYDVNPAQRKDLVIASALMLEPEVLLLDEPTLGRDEPALLRLNRLIAEFTRTGGAVIATTHDLTWAETTSHRNLHLSRGSLG